MVHMLDVSLLIADEPGEPENLQASDIHGDHLKLSWLPPSDNGGAEILGKDFIKYSAAVMI